MSEYVLSLLGTLLGLLIVATPPMGALIALVTGARGIKHFGWKTRQGLVYWNGILAGLYGAYVISHIVHATPLSIVGMAIGLVGGGVLLITVKPRWPTHVSLWQVLALTLFSVVIGLVLVRL